MDNLEDAVVDEDIGKSRDASRTDDEAVARCVTNILKAIVDMAMAKLQSIAKVYIVRIYCVTRFSLCQSTNDGI